MSRSDDQMAGDDFNQRYSTLIDQAFSATACVDEDFLREMGFHETVVGLFTVAGWPRFLSWRGETDVEDVCEFLASLEKHKGGKEIRYRHRGVYYTASARQVAEGLGFEVVTNRRGLDAHSNRVFWNELTGRNDYEAGQSNVREIREPLWFYMAKLITHSIVGRDGGSQKPGLVDMEVLRGMYYGRKVDFYNVLKTHWLRTRGRGTIVCGGLITTYLRATHGSEVWTTHMHLSFDPYTHEKLVNMRCITMGEDGTVIWKCGANVAQRPVQNIGGGAFEGAGGAPAGSQGAPAGFHPAPAPADHAPAGFGHPDAFFEAQRNWMFNASRVLEYLAPPGADLAINAPSYWQPGLPIPHGYHLREQDNEDEDDEGDEDTDMSSETF